MRLKEQVWQVSATVLSLAAFSYFAGLGLRGLMGPATRSQASERDSLALYPKFASAAPRVSDPDVRPAMLFREVLQKLQLYYVEPLPKGSVLTQGAVEAMLNQLNDPNTRLISKVEMEALQGAARGEFTGMGAVLTIRRHSQRDSEELARSEQQGRKTGPPSGAEKDTPVTGSPNAGVRTVTVVSTIPGGAAEKAGLKPGDRITEIDGQWIAPAHVSYRLLTQLTDPIGPQEGRPRDPDEDLSDLKNNPALKKAREEAEEASRRWKNATDLPTAMQTLMGPKPGEHELTVERGTPSKTLKVKVALGTSRVPVFASRKLDDSTGYIQVLAMSGGTADQVQSALTDFKKSGVQRLVLDLRESAGGSLDAARDIAGMLMGDGKFAVLKERDPDRKLVDRPLLIKGATVALKPAAISVLVDGGTSGSAELLAAALRDHLGAKLVGSTTFGDGTEQEVLRLDNGAGVSVTRAKMLTSKGVDYDGKGLKADVPAEGDPVEAAVKALASAAPAPSGKGA